MKPEPKPKSIKYDTFFSKKRIHVPLLAACICGKKEPTLLNMSLLAGSFIIGAGGRAVPWSSTGLMLLAVPKVALSSMIDWFYFSIQQYERSKAISVLYVNLSTVI